MINELKKHAVDIFIKMRKKIKNRVFNNAQKYLLNKRGIIETIIGLLKE
jgi:hypothetical protein